MSNSRHPKKTDAGKTKQQLIDELNLLRRELGELQQPTSERDKQSRKDLQSVLEKLARDQALNSNILASTHPRNSSLVTALGRSSENLSSFSCRVSSDASIESMCKILSAQKAPPGT